MISESDKWKDYWKLCDRVEKVNPDAADYMRSDATNLISFDPAFCLSSSFIWGDTAQGHEYWKSVNDRLGDGYV